jgi:site-specific DNA recombinase
MKRAALYARVSTARQEQEETIDSQIAEVRQRIESDEALLLDSSIYVDEGYSGSLLERPSLDAMLNAAKNKEFDVLYIYDLGRLSRQLSHLLIVIEQLDKYEREVVSLHERITGTPEDKFLLQIMGSMHEYERAKIAERFRRGKMYKAKSGKLVGYNAPYGYSYNRETGSFEVNETEAATVRKMFEWVALEGLSTYALITRLHELGIKPPKNQNEYWSRSPIARILSNESYFGRHHFNKTESTLPRKRQTESKYRKIQKTGRRMRPRDEWIEFSIPAIISEDLFRKARVQLERNTKFNPKNRKHDYLLTSLIKCTCGANRNGDGPAGKKYYRCTSRNRTHPIKNHCTVGGINVTVADGLVWNELSNVMANPKLIRKHAEEWLKRQKASNTVTNALSMKSRLSELENEQKRYVDAYGKGFMPEALFAEKIKETNRQIEALKIDIAKASENRGVAGKIDVEQLVQKAALKLGNLNFDQKKHIVERVVDKIIASPKEIIIWGHLPSSALAAVGKVNHVSQHRHRWSTKCRQIYPV